MLLAKSSLDTPSYAINGNLIRQMFQHKDLGVTFSTDLHWTEHYKIIIAKAYQTLRLLRRTFNINSIAAKKQLYISLVRSQLLYCSQLWRPHFFVVVCIKNKWHYWNLGPFNKMMYHFHPFEWQT